MRHLLGGLAVFALELAARLPMRLALALGGALLPLYAPFRFATRRKLRALRPPVGPLAYYHMRLRLALLSVRQATGREDGYRRAIEGEDLYSRVLSSGKPVLLLGWHQGPVELLHAIPAAASSGRPFFVVTASAFSPVLAEWMARGRERTGVRVVRPEETGKLRAWAREGGVLAVMIDQVPGRPEEYLSLRDGAMNVPWPGRLIDWALARNPEILVVSARLAGGRRVAFRYARCRAESAKEDVRDLMDDALARAPEQYNWSYGKVSLLSTADG